MLGEGGLDLGRLHAHAADLDLPVPPPVERDRAVGVEAAEVTAGVHPRAKRSRGRIVPERVGEEALLGQVGTIQVATGDARAADEHLAHHPRGNRAPRFVEDVDGGVADGPADRREALSSLGHHAGRRAHGGLGRAVRVRQREREAGGREDVEAIPRHVHHAERSALGPRPRQRGLGQRGGEEAQRDAAGGDPVGQRRGLGHQLGRHHVEGGPGREGRPDLPDGRVEGHARELRASIGGAQLEVVVVPEDRVVQVPLRHQHALRHARGARSVDHVREVVRPGGGRRLRRAALVEAAEDVQARDGPVDDRVDGAPGEDHPRRGVAGDERQAVARVPGIERQVRAARLPDRELADHQLQGALDADPDDRLRPHPHRAEPPRDRAGAGVQVAVAERRSVGADERRSLGRGAGVLGDQLGDGGAERPILPGPPAPGHDPAPFLRGQDRDLEQRQIRVPRHGLERVLEVGRHLDHPRLVEQVGAVLERARQPLVLRLHDEREVELRRGGLERRHLHLEIAQPHLAGALGLDGEHHLEQGVVPQVPRRSERGHHALEGHVLMRIGLERGAADALHQLGEGGVAREVDPDGQGVEEEADDALGLAPVPVGRRHADHDVVLPADASQVRGERAEQRHEQRGARAPGQLLQPAAERRREREGLRAPAERLLPRPRAIGGQGQAGRRGGQRLAPEGQALVELAGGQAPVLPGRPVRVADRQLRQLRAPLRRERRVGMSELTQEYGERPCVGHDVMLVDDQDVLVPASEPEETGPEEGAGGQRERRVDLFLDALVDLEGVDVVDRQHLGAPARDPLHRMPGAVGERGAQRVVTVDQHLERLAERSDVQRARQPEDQRDVVGGAGAAQRVEEPQALLARRGRDVSGQVDAGNALEAGAAAGDRLGKGRDRPSLEDQPHREVDAEDLAGASDDLGGLERVAADREEVVVHADPLHAEQLLAEVHGLDETLRHQVCILTRWVVLHPLQ